MSLTPDQLRAMFPHASADMLRLNAGLSVTPKEAALRAAWPAKVDAMVAPLKGAPVPAAAPKKRLRQSTATLNKTEQAFLDFLTATYPRDAIFTQAMTLRIANGCRYTPDFMLCSSTGKWFAYEVKGFMRDDAAVKIKVAAAMFSRIKFFLVTRHRGGEWKLQKVLP